VGSYSLSRKADADIDRIAETSLQKWGLARADKYILELHETFQRLAHFPDHGRDASHIRLGYRMIGTMSHVVFYRATKHGVLIVRVLHQPMDFLRHLLAEDKSLTASLHSIQS
jgi:toxin ParE1/3/4